MSTVSEKQQVLKALSEVMDPDLNRDIVSLGFIKDLELRSSSVLGNKKTVQFKIELTTPACPVKDLLKDQALRCVQKLDFVSDINIEMTARVRTTGVAGPMVRGVKNILLVGSGKGGVGKSSVAVNVAMSLAQSGAQMGLLDADVYGPSLGMMLSAPAKMPEVRNSRILPVKVQGIRLMSMAFFAPVGDAVLWKGAMVAKAIHQMLFDVDWTEDGQTELDYLVVDLPPGTGDIPMTIIQSVGVAGAILVSTPQDVALLDTAKGLALFERFKVPVLGLVENMSGFVCPHCHKVSAIFGQGGGSSFAAQHRIPFLGSIPLDPSIVQRGDSGVPLVVENPEHVASKAYQSIAGQVVAQLSRRQAVLE
jgi:ATP-binding protein involved in chromosome partitioning